jgi:hypothetical protein
VFSTWLVTGDGSAPAVNNGIDVSSVHPFFRRASVNLESIDTIHCGVFQDILFVRVNARKS